MLTDLKEFSHDKNFSVTLVSNKHEDKSSTKLFISGGFSFIFLYLPDMRLRIYVVYIQGRRKNSLVRGSVTPRVHVSVHEQ